MANVDLEYINKLTPKNMANYTDNEKQATGSQKLLTLANLARYNHKLISQLGLTNDTAGYAYHPADGSEGYAPSVFKEDGTSINPSFTKADNVKQALDQLYDLVAAGSGITSVAGGKSDLADAKTVAFAKVGTETDKELYYVHFVNSDGTETNLELDAEDFVKDSVIDGSNTKIVYSAAETIASQSNLSAADLETLPSGVSEERTAGDKTYIALVIKNAKDPEAEQTYSRYFISMSDVLGDLAGGDGIDLTDEVIKVDFTDSDEYVKLTLTGDEEGSKQLDIVVTYGTRKDTVIEGGVKSVADIKTTAFATDEDGVATEEDLTTVANTLQDEIEFLADHLGSTEILSGANVETVPAEGEGETVSFVEKSSQYVRTKTDATTGKSTITIGNVVATDTEIDAIFDEHKS